MESGNNTIYKNNLNSRSYSQTGFTKLSRSIPSEFLNSMQDEVRQLIAEIEIDMQNLNDMEESYKEFTNLIKCEKVP